MSVVWKMNVSENAGIITTSSVNKGDCPGLTDLCCVGNYSFIMKHYISHMMYDCFICLLTILCILLPVTESLK